LAFVFDLLEEQWLECNDRKVSVTDESKALFESTNNCYLLVYSALYEDHEESSSSEESGVEAVEEGNEDEENARNEDVTQEEEIVSNAEDSDNDSFKDCSDELVEGPAPTPPASPSKRKIEETEISGKKMCVEEESSGSDEEENEEQSE
jgi:hypothetical protein